jgi:hypothetical protein
VGGTSKNQTGELQHRVVRRLFENFPCPSPITSGSFEVLRAQGPKDRFAGRWVNLYTVESKTTIQTHAGFLERIERYLDKAGATFAVTQQGPPPLVPNYSRLLRLHQDDQRVVKQLLDSKAGGATVMTMERIEPIICACVDAFGARETVVVVRDVMLTAQDSDRNAEIDKTAGRNNPLRL